VRLLWQPLATQDIDEIWVYSFDRWGLVRADDYISDLRMRAEALARGDLSGTPADDVAQGLRRLMAGAHVIWFRASDDAVRIVRVLHQRQDVDRDMA
jgi:toxin ParE1/3/4